MQRNAGPTREASADTSLPIAGHTEAAPFEATFARARMEASSLNHRKRHSNVIFLTYLHYLANLYESGVP
jgi:hypothetical protein